MNIFLIILIILSTVIFSGYILFLYIRYKYRLFCQKQDQIERIDILRKKIHSSTSYIRTNFKNDIQLQNNLIPKISFIENLILKKSLNDQEKELDFLLDIITETFSRIHNRYDDVQYIMSPLNTLRDRIVQEHIQFIKDHAPEEFQI